MSAPFFGSSQLVRDKTTIVAKQSLFLAVYQQVSLPKWVLSFLHFIASIGDSSESLSISINLARQTQPLNYLLSSFLPNWE